MHSLTERFQSVLREFELVPSSGHVLVACSGGLDSVVLLFLLRESAKALGIRVSAAHFDHSMRVGSAADAEWVSGLCRAWNIPLRSERATHAIRNEAEARAARYAFLEAATEAVDADRIATAHHADDQAETVLFRMLRGTGVDGLAGIPIRRGRIILTSARIHPGATARLRARKPAAVAGRSHQSFSGVRTQSHSHATIARARSALAIST